MANNTGQQPGQWYLMMMMSYGSNGAAAAVQSLRNVSVESELAGSGGHQVARCPERWMQSKFDLAGQSHQLIHVLVIADAYTHYLATSTRGTGHWANGHTATVPTSLSGEGWWGSCDSAATGSPASSSPSPAGTAGHRGLLLLRGAAAACGVELPSTCGCDSAGSGAKRRTPASSSSSSGAQQHEAGGAGRSGGRAGGQRREADRTKWGCGGRTRGRSLLEVVVLGATDRRHRGQRGEMGRWGEGRKKRWG
nr:uncharacterized protein LOC112938665 [Oryza sativa Japonica Group]